MKNRTLLSLAILLFAVTQAYAKTTITAHVGATRSTMTGIPDEAGAKVKARVAPLLGVSIEQADFPIMFGVAITNKGISAEATDDDLLGDFSAGWRLRYLEFSALGKLSTPIDETTSAYALLGGFAGIQIGCNVVAGIAGVSANVSCDNPELELKHENKHRLGIVGGGGISKKIGNVWLSWDVTYNMDLNSMSMDGDKSKHRTLGTKLGIGIPFGNP